MRVVKEDRSSPPTTPTCQPANTSRSLTQQQLEPLTGAVPVTLFMVGAKMKRVHCIHPLTYHLCPVTFHMSIEINTKQPV